ncbi:hypothetical protein HJC23_010200 [Cyclotella cryptica]|uniref:Glutaredoxin domain-containing protein n=1 Tax=Cyclotella cryptica TaxID=29204 RepID=A0ABD3PGD1_9STRA|eukprot:CCRYP_014721-RA/>CCRYP_014721-RA protein AED:0.35 eAED:0.35 QI:63/1/1/1/0/0/2/2390/172
MDTFAFFSFVLIVFDFICVATAFGASTASFACISICQQSSSRLHYNVPRKRPAHTEVNNLWFDSGSGIATPLDFILSEIRSSDVVIFSTTHCPHCIETKQLFSRLNINAKIIELDRIKNGLGSGDDSIAMKLYEISGQRTVPNVFVKGKHLGGNDETQASARSGKLQCLLLS